MTLGGLKGANCSGWSQERGPESQLFLNRVSQVRILPGAPPTHQEKSLLTSADTLKADLVVCVPKVLHGRSWRAETDAQEIFAVWMNSLDLDLGEGRSPLGVEVLCEDGATFSPLFVLPRNSAGLAVLRATR
ncbi:MAG: hypothetical protein JO272_03980 [Pseudonocardiales bacterium]|nr:hypothetical protein [Pseudonocardiales bacterium]